MQAVLATTMREVDYKMELRTLFTELESADNTQKNRIENKIVSFGESAIEFLIDKLMNSRGVQRGVAAMSLIRIGEASIEKLKMLASANKNFTWVANYIIQEIEGTF